MKNNPPLHLKLEPSPGAEIGDCYDHAAKIVRKVGCVVNFDFNEVFCGVRPCDIRGKGRRARFIEVYHREMTKKAGCKICYANP
ncbi:MAG TPA: hypothetical protein VEC57_00220 [Candidatus Limnocylindrales bacterium]|nr:hypothetical protein [Candidatus Limnocylindrales bacterium]